MSYVLLGIGLIVVGFWIVSVELRLEAAKLLGEIVWDDMHERGKAPKREAKP